MVFFCYNGDYNKLEILVSLPLGCFISDHPTLFGKSSMTKEF